MKEELGWKLHTLLCWVQHCVRLRVNVPFVQTIDCLSSSPSPAPPAAGLLSLTPSSLKGQKRRSSSRREKVRPPALETFRLVRYCCLELFTATLAACVCSCVCFSENKSRRVELSTASLLKVAPTAEERKIVHSLFLNTLDTKYE